MSDQSKLGLGHIITTPQQRDAIHVAVAPVVAATRLSPGEHVLVDQYGARASSKGIGVVDPFLREEVKKGETFWLFLYPGTITSLRHDWTHPQMPVGEATKTPEPVRSESEQWMRRWAVRNMLADLMDYGYASSEDGAYEYAIRAGHDMSVGPCENSRDHIDEEWWNHWEAITGKQGQRDEYFSCGC